MTVRRPNARWSVAGEAHLVLYDKRKRPERRFTIDEQRRSLQQKRS
jgi:hypothetical protein